MSTETVLISATKHLIKERQDLYCWLNEVPPPTRLTPHLPSWVMDWIVPESSVVPYSFANGLQDLTAHVANRKRIFVDEDLELHVQAHALDRVTYVSARFSKLNYRRLCLEVFQTVPGLSKKELHPSRVERFIRAVAQDPGFVVEKMGTLYEYYTTMNLSANSLLAEEVLLRYL